MNVVRTITELRGALEPRRCSGETIGFVPTMGAFHEGHCSLMRRARSECAAVVVSLFVNPAQFNQPSDLDAYPRDDARDTELAASEEVDLLFVPSVAEMYPAGFATTVVVAGVAEPLEGAIRGPRHFQGVATVVTKLFNIVRPDVAYFGQKDAQQVLVIRRMVRDLDLPIRIAVCPTVREADGLALSSRNALLQPSQRPQALALRRGLDAAKRAIRDGARDAREIEAVGTAAMQMVGVEPEYFAVTAIDTLDPVRVVTGDVLIAAAARVGAVRLIDNDLVHIP